MNKRNRALLLMQARFAMKLLRQATPTPPEARHYHSNMTPKHRLMGPGSVDGAVREAMDLRYSKLSRLGRLLMRECLENDHHPNGCFWTTKCLVWAAVSKDYCNARFSEYSPEMQAILQPFHYRVHPMATDFTGHLDEPGIVRYQSFDMPRLRANGRTPPGFIPKFTAQTLRVYGRDTPKPTDFPDATNQ